MYAVLIKAGLSFLTKLAASLATEVMLEWLFFKVAGELVKRTDTPHDDDFYNKVKELYDSKQKGV